jgi:hypothetical protein
MALNVEDNVMPKCDLEDMPTVAQMYDTPRTVLSQLLYWLEDCRDRPTLRDLQHVCDILSAWEVDYMKVHGVPVSWPPSSEEMAINRRLVAVCERLRAKGQFTID